MKWIPGQATFMATRNGHLPSVQPLIEAGLLYAPYIEHGSWVTGQSDIAKYGRDPYRGLGMTTTPENGLRHLSPAVQDQARRRGFVVVVHRTGQSVPARTLRQAKMASMRLAAQHPWEAIHIHVRSLPLSKATLVAATTLMRPGMGSVLTDLACDNHTFVQVWRERVNTSIAVGTEAAVLGGVAAGLIGGVLRRPLMGAIIGAVVGWGAHHIWTAPHQISV